MDKDQILQFLDSQVSWLGQSAFRLTTRTGLVIYIDPFRVPNEAPKADFILVTHSHGDHYSAKAIEAMRTEKTKIIAPLGMAAIATDPMDVGQKKDFGDLAVESFHAYNQRGFPHSPSKNWLGFLLRFDGLSVYHAGDTDSVSEVVGLKPDVAFLPVAGLATFGIREGVEAAQKIGAIVTVPMHYGLIPGTKKNGEKFVAAYPGTSTLLKKV